MRVWVTVGWLNEGMSHSRLIEWGREPQEFVWMRAWFTGGWLNEGVSHRRLIEWGRESQEVDWMRACHRRLIEWGSESQEVDWMRAWKQSRKFEINVWRLKTRICDVTTIKTVFSHTAGSDCYSKFSSFWLINEWRIREGVTVNSDGRSWVLWNSAS